MKFAPGPWRAGLPPGRKRNVFFRGYSRPGDQDLGSYGAVRILDETRWEPKRVFHAMAARHRRL